MSGVPETVSEEHGANPCVCTAGCRAAGGSLPRIYADVRCVGCEEWTRCRVVDTCSVRTLLSSSVAAKMGLSVQSAESSSLIALDGKPIKISGVVSIELQRANDGPVFLPKTTVDAVVVDSLETVEATFLIGADVISSLGGVQLEYGKNNVLCGVVFGLQNAKSGANVAAAIAGDNHPSQHVEVLRDGADTILRAEDGEVHWIADKAHWQLTWRWKDGHPPDAMIGSGVGEYSRKHLTAEQKSSSVKRSSHGSRTNGWLSMIQRCMVNLVVCCLCWQGRRSTSHQHRFAHVFIIGL